MWPDNLSIDIGVDITVGEGKLRSLDGVFNVFWLITNCACWNEIPRRCALPV
jgi:hypothetical protein